MINIFKQITANNIPLEPYDFKKELAMEAYIMENESILKLDSVNFSEPTVIEVELALKEGRANRDGRIDILARYSEDVYAIVELKLDEVNRATLNQLEGYLRQRHQLKRFIDDEEEKAIARDEIKWVGIMVGKTISREMADLLSGGNGYEFDCDGTKIPIAAITINRYRSKVTTEIFVVSDTYFKFSSNNRDYTKYIFEGIEYNKGQLVNAIIKKYVQTNPNTSYSELEKVFPQRLQGSFGVFTSENTARELYAKHNGRYKRHRLEPEDLIKLSDCTIATSTQWGKGNVSVFIENAKKLGMDVTCK